MQKLLTVAIDAKLLINGLHSPFNITEVEAINELLVQGWEIEEWNFLKEEAGTGVILLIVILNDSSMYVEADELSEDFYSDGELDELEMELMN
jgi:hypothetical protein